MAEGILNAKNGLRFGWKNQTGLWCEWMNLAAYPVTNTEGQ